MTEEEYAKRTIELSKKSVETGGYPVGALVVSNGEIVGEGFSDGKQLNECEIIRQKIKLRNEALFFYPQIVLDKNIIMYYCTSTY